MKRIKEFMNDMTTEGWITTAIIGALLIVVLIGTLVTVIGKSDENSFSMKKDVEVTEVREENSDSVFIEEIPATDKNASISNGVVYSSPTSVSYEAKKQEVEIALIIEENQYDVKNIIEGVCGNVYMVTAYVPGPTVLTNSFKALFGDKIFGDFMPGNIIPSYHPNLKFKDVVITNGVAKIYLTGSFKETQKNSCDTALAIAQLTETAKNYPNVKSVEIYLGSKKVN